VLNAARWKCRTQKVAICAASYNFVRAIYSQLRHISTIGKKLVKQQYLLQISQQYDGLRLLAAEIDPVVWGTPANFNGFRVLAALLHGSHVVRVSQTAALNIGRHICLAGRPSGWALAHILVSYMHTYVYFSKRKWYLSSLFLA